MKKMLYASFAIIMLANMGPIHGMVETDKETSKRFLQSLPYEVRTRLDELCNADCNYICKTLGRASPEIRNTLIEAMQYNSTSLSILHDHLLPNDLIATFIMAEYLGVTRLQLMSSHTPVKAVLEVLETALLERSQQCTITDITLGGDQIDNFLAFHILQLVTKPESKITSLSFNSSSISDELTEEVQIINKRREDMKKPPVTVTFIRHETKENIPPAAPEGDEEFARRLTAQNYPQSNVSYDIPHLGFSSFFPEDHSPQASFSDTEVNWPSALRENQSAFTTSDACILEAQAAAFHNEGTSYSGGYISPITDISDNEPLDEESSVYKKADYSGCEVTLQNLPDILSSLSHYTTNLNLSDNDIGNTGAECIANAIASPDWHVTQLNLSNNNIGNEGARLIVEKILENEQAVTELNFHGNPIDEATKNELTETVAAFGNNLRVIF